MTLWLILPPEVKTPTSDPEYRSLKILAQGRKMLEYLVETSDELQITVSKWARPPQPPAEHNQEQAP